MGAPVSTNSYLRPTQILLGSTSEIYVVERARIDARVPRKFHWSMTRTKHRYVDRKLIDCPWKGRGCYFFSKKYRHTVCVQWISVNTYKSVALLIRAFNSLTHASRSTHSNVDVIRHWTSIFGRDISRVSPVPVPWQIFSSCVQLVSNLRDENSVGRTESNELQLNEL